MKSRKPACVQLAIAGVAGLVAVLNGQTNAVTLQGAPPAIPHAIRSDYKCQHCHTINNNPGTSHLLRNNCLQCHVSIATNEKHQMLEMDWDQFAGYWEAESIGAPAREMDIVESYEGAPPSIPHSTTWTKNCQDCHSSNMKNGPVTSHPDRGNCTQCHVSIATMESRQFLEPDPAAFQVGWASAVTARKQARRNPAMQPTVIPHEINGYEDCLMCHSPEDTMGLATTHPERKNCIQCHVTEATTEDRKFLTQSLTELK